MLLLATDTRCRPIKTDCSLKERCARFVATVPFGGTAADFSAGPAGCVGKYIPTGAVPRVVRPVHEHPGGAL